MGHRTGPTDPFTEVKDQTDMTHLIIVTMENTTKIIFLSIEV